MHVTPIYCIFVAVVQEATEIFYYLEGSSLSDCCYVT